MAARCFESMYLGMTGHCRAKSITDEDTGLAISMAPNIDGLVLCSNWLAVCTFSLLGRG